MNRILTCVYCGQEYPQNTPPHSSKVLTDHIKICEKHPLREAEAKITKLRGALLGLIGSETTKEEVRAMITLLRSMPHEGQQSVIHALEVWLETEPVQ